MESDTPVLLGMSYHHTSMKNKQIDIPVRISWSTIQYPCFTLLIPTSFTQYISATVLYTVAANLQNNYYSWLFSHQS